MAHPEHFGSRFPPPEIQPNEFKDADPTPEVQGQDVPEPVPEAEINEYRPAFESPEKQECLRQRTADLIERVMEENIQTLVFMDRSARPLSWALRAAWDKERLGRDLPKIKFVNIGREKADILGYQGSAPGRYEFGSEVEWQGAVEEYWRKLDSDDYVAALKRDLGQDALHREQILLVDDWSESGYSIGVAKDFFRRHLPKNPVHSHSFFQREDLKLFNKKDWNGIYLPWSQDKSYTLMADDADPSSVTAAVERDPARRAKGLALRREIEDIFSEKDGSKGA